MWKTALIATVLVALIGCSRGTEEVSSASADVPTIPTQAEIDALVAEGTEPLVRRLAVGDYYLHYHLMRETGMFEALGGEEQAIAALKAIGEEYERRMRWAEDEAPKMIPASFTGEGMSAGMYGFGSGAVGGFLSGSILREMLGSGMSDDQFSRMVEAMDQNGPVKLTDSKGTIELKIGEDGRYDQVIEYDVEENSVKGKLKVKIHIDGCPDPQGKMTIGFDIDSQMSVVGKAGTGGYVRAQYEKDAWLDDDAQLINTSEGREQKLHVEMGGFENYRGQHYTFTESVARGGKTSFTENKASGFSIFRPAEIARQQTNMSSIADSLHWVTEVMLRGINNPPWESGRCVDMDVKTNPEKRTGADPGTQYRITVIPRAKSDGQVTTGTVRATLSGDSSLDPADTKVQVESDVKFQYDNPNQKDKEASITFEARSKRGVGRASLAFDTKKKGYVIGGCRLSGRVPDVDGPFDASVSGYSFRFTPTGEKAGTWRWSNPHAQGSGPYHITLDEDAQSGTLTLPPGKNVIGGQTHTTEAWTCTLTAVKD